MSDTVCAAALACLVIPLVTTSICRKLWQHGLAASRGRRQPNGDVCGAGFAIQVALLFASCYAFKHLAANIEIEAEYFDPFEILELPSSANATVIRSQYRRLSLKHHPDKNLDRRREAAKKFDQVTKAYKALSDPEAKRNWEKYGHPDGYQPWTFDLALPGWLTPGQDTDNQTMALYAAGYLTILIGFILSVKLGLDLIDPTGRDKKPIRQVTEEDVQALLRHLDDTSSTPDVMECLAASPHLCSEERRDLARDMEAVTAPIRNWLLGLDGGAPPLTSPGLPSLSAAQSSRSGKKSKGSKKSKASSAGGSRSGDGGGGGGGAAGDDVGQVDGEYFSHGRKGEGNRRAARTDPELSRVVTHNLVILLSALHRWSSEKGALRGGAINEAGESEGESGEHEGADSAAAAVSVANQLTREQDAVFGHAEPLLDACLQVAAKRASPQLFGTVVEAKAMLRRRLWSSQDPAALEKQEKEADIDLDAAVPCIQVTNVAVETWGESQIAVGDTVTATITIRRDHAAEYRGLRRRRPEGGFLSKGEPWWIILASARGETLVGLTPELVGNLGNGTVECKIKFRAPGRPGVVSLVVFVKSPVFVGCDCEASASFRVYRHDELKEDAGEDDW